MAMVLRTLLLLGSMARGTDVGGSRQTPNGGGSTVPSFSTVVARGWRRRRACSSARAFLHRQRRPVGAGATDKPVTAVRTSA